MTVSADLFCNCLFSFFSPSLPPSLPPFLSSFFSFLFFSLSFFLSFFLSSSSKYAVYL